MTRLKQISEKPDGGETRRLRTGFTLIELLAVIAVLAVLAAILIPVVSSAIESSRIAKNISNMRQLGAAFDLYSVEHGGKLPPSRYPPGVVPGQERWWTAQIAPYIDDYDVLLRPGADINNIGSNENPGGVTAPLSKVKESKLEGIPRYWSYGINGNFSDSAFPQAPEGRSLSTITQPAQLIALYDGWIWFGGSPQIKRNRIHTWRDGKTTILWMDGRVSRVRPEDLEDSDAIVE